MEFSPQKSIDETMQWIVSDILIPHFMGLGLNASGEWVQNLNTRVEGDQGIINGRKYTEQLVWGRKPGKRPPISALEKWVQVKLGLSEKQALGAAFAIANKIAQEGTEIYKNNGTDLLEVLNKPENIRRINEYLGSRLKTDAMLFIQRQIK